MSDKYINVERYKVISEVKLLDGFVIESDFDVRRILESPEENKNINVIYEEADVKRIFWIKKDNLELISSKEELISNREYETEIKDRYESWFD